jgi:multiple sugar transport system ATP-binding protein
MNHDSDDSNEYQLRLERLSKRYGSVVALDDFDLRVSSGELVTLVGPSGCGKSTSLRLIAGLEEPSSGDVYIRGKLANHLPPGRRNVAMVFQSYALFPHMTVAGNLAFGLKIKRLSAGDVADRVDWALKLLGLERLEERLPKQLSGGQRQRVALGRALVLQPQVLLLDEPLSNLDAKLRGRMRTELKRLHRKLNNTVIYVTHDQLEAMTLSDRVAVMNEGRLIQLGTAEQVYTSPKNLFVAGFIGTYPMNLLSAQLITGETGPMIQAEGFSLPVDERFVRGVSRPGQQLILGIRPEDFSLAAPGEGDLTGLVEVVEPTGAEVLITFTVGRTAVKGVLPAKLKLNPGDKLELTVDRERIHLFDKAEESNLLLGKTF